MSSLPHVAIRPAFIEHGSYRFLIIDAPNDSNLDAYIKEFKKYQVTDVVRACEPTYDRERVVREGVSVHDLAFTDGDPPPPDVIERFLKLCDDRFGKGNPSNNAIAVHCVAGLGRAPVLVAIALIDAGLEPLDAVERVRAKRRGAINTKQLYWVEHQYKRRKKDGCAVM